MGDYGGFLRREYMLPPSSFLSSHFPSVKELLLFPAKSFLFPFFSRRQFGGPHKGLPVIGQGDPFQGCLR